MPSILITNRPDHLVFGRCPVETAWLSRPETDWAYAHHASLTHFGGRYHAIWSNGMVNEDDVGQRVLLSSSADFSTWTEPRPLLDSMPGRDSGLVLTAAGFHAHADTLVAYVGHYEYRPEFLGPDGRRRVGDKGHMDVGLMALTSRDGTVWDAPRDLAIQAIPNHGPQRTRSGRLIISGNALFPYTDNPSGLAGWTESWLYPEAAETRAPDDSEQFTRLAREAGLPVSLCEGSWFETDDGVLHLLLRSNTPRLWQSESRDDGLTWSRPVQSEFSDDCTKFHFGRLPDGRFYYVGNPVRGGGRSPLVLSLSEDGITFGRHYVMGDDRYTRRVEGMHKNGQFGYPHTLVHDGWLCMIVSRCKEAVQALRVRISDLG